MSAHPLSDDDLREAVELVNLHGGISQAARAADMPRSSFSHRYRMAAAKGLMGFAPVLPGFQIKKTSVQLGPDGEKQKEWIQQHPEPGEPFAVPDGHVVRGVSALVDRDDRVINKWVKTKVDGDSVDWVEVFKTAFAEYEGRAAAIPAPTLYDPDFLNLFPANDWHINMLAWRREVGENWDLHIAERVIGDAIDACVSRTRSGGIGIVLGGGDLMHNDDNTNRTAKSHNVLDADGRHAKGIEVAQRLKVRMIDRVLETHNRVVVRVLAGNHDEQSSTAIAHFLKAWYRNEPRIEVDTDQSLYWYYQFGKVMLAATHGHTVKLKDMPSIMAHRRPEIWGDTKFRYAHGFHIHHKEKIATEGEGVICESHQAPIPQDGWHYGCGYLSGRSVKSITYHKDLGEWTCTREPILDGQGDGS